MPKVEPSLAKRLEVLTGEDASCCVADYKAEAREARAADGFGLALSRAKAMSDEKRLLALALIRRRGAMCACEVQAALDLTHGTVSHHMRTLEEADLIEVERRGRWAYYRLTPEAKEIVP